MKAVILAAGDGTRMRPLTANLPKPLLPVAGKPFLQYTLETLSAAGITEAHILVGWKQDRIKDRLGDGTKFGIKLNYEEQEERLGTAHAVSMFRNAVDEDFICINGDVIVTKKMLTDLIERYNEKKTNIITVVHVPNPSAFGVVDMNAEGKVLEISEKPAKPRSNNANAGVYLFTKEIFDAISRTPKSKRNEYEVTKSLSFLIEEGKVHACVSSDPWLDIGKPWDLLTANEILMKGMTSTMVQGELDPYVTIKGPVMIGRGTVVRNGAYIIGPAIIGDDCEIGPNCLIRPYTTIGNKCKVGNAVEVKNSIIMDGSHVPHLNYVGDSIIGERCNLGAGTKVANLRLDNKNVKSFLKGESVDSGRRKLGVVMGDDVKTGINASIEPGTIICEESFIGPGALAKGFIAPHSRVH